MRGLNSSTLNLTPKETLMGGEPFGPLSPRTQIQCLGQLAPSSWFTTEIQNAAVFVNEEWIVWIHGKTLLHCVSAFSVFLNYVSQELDTPIAIELLTHHNESDEPLYRVLQRQSRSNKVMRTVTWGSAILLSVGLGALVQCWV